MYGYGEYQYTVGNVVQLTRTSQAWQVIWRGQVQVQHEGRWYRQNVYRLDNGFWDCYHEHELHSAWRWGYDG